MGRFIIDWDQNKPFLKFFNTAFHVPKWTFKLMSEGLLELNEICLSIILKTLRYRMLKGLASKRWLSVAPAYSKLLQSNRNYLSLFMKFNFWRKLVLMTLGNYIVSFWIWNNFWILINDMPGRMIIIVWVFAVSFIWVQISII